VKIAVEGSDDEDTAQHTSMCCKPLTYIWTSLASFACGIFNIKSFDFDRNSRKL